MSSFKELVDQYSDITEAYEILKTVEVVKDGRQRYRLDVIKSLKNEEYYDVRLFIYEDWAEYKRLIVTHEKPWLKEPTPELALRCAINFILTGNIH
jgi:hypothetical protein